MMFVCIVGAKTTNIEHENDFSLQESETNISIVQSTCSTESELIIYYIHYFQICSSVQSDLNVTCICEQFSELTP